jgi:hypothetical protein
MKMPRRLFRRIRPRPPDLRSRPACPEQHQWVDPADIAPDYDQQRNYWDYQCRLCHAIGIQCQWCLGTKYGHGGIYSTDPEQLDRTQPKEVCPRCHGKGIIEIVEITLNEVQRLRAKAGDS